MDIAIIIVCYIKARKVFRNEILNTDEEISKAIGVSNYCSHVFVFQMALHLQITNIKRKKHS